MSSSCRVMGLVPARGGSKRLPGKNLLEVAGASLVARAVRSGAKSRSVDVVVVSSDDDDILAEGQRAGAEPSARPPELAGDATPTIDVVLHELSLRPEVETVVLLQPTSPLRDAADVRACLDVHEPSRPVVTVTAVHHPPAWTFHRDPDGALHPILGWDGLALRGQDHRDSYTLNGAVYVASRRHLEEHRSFLGPATRSVVMPPERSVDVDTHLDLALARLIAFEAGSRVSPTRER